MGGLKDSIHIVASMLFVALSVCQNTGRDCFFKTTGMTISCPSLSQLAMNNNNLISLGLDEYLFFSFFECTKAILADHFTILLFALPCSTLDHNHFHDIKTIKIFLRTLSLYVLKQNNKDLNCNNNIFNPIRLLGSPKRIRLRI